MSDNKNILYNFIQFVGHVSRQVSDMLKKCVHHVSWRLPDEKVKKYHKKMEEKNAKKKPPPRGYMTWLQSYVLVGEV